MENIFENAYFGKRYVTRGNKTAIYHGSKEHKSSDGKVWTYHYLMIEPTTINFLGKDIIINHYDAYINDNGIGRLANLKYYKDSGASAEYDIISEWEEPINDEELDNIASESLKNSEWVGHRALAIYHDGFKAGYLKALKHE